MNSYKNNNNNMKINATTKANQFYRTAAQRSPLNSNHIEIVDDHAYQTKNNVIVFPKDLIKIKKQKH